MQLSLHIQSNAHKSREKEPYSKVTNFVNDMFRLKSNFKDMYTWTI